MAAMKNIYNKPGQSAPAMHACEYVDDTHLKLYFDKDIYMFTMDDTAYGMDVEDEGGLIPCKKAVGSYGILELETERPFTLPAKFHAYWRCNLPSLLVRDMHGLPLLGCYNVEIKRNYNK